MLGKKNDLGDVIAADSSGNTSHSKESGPMTLLERVGATTDVLGSYKRGLRVGRERTIIEVVEWMVERGYPVGEEDNLPTLLSELERMSQEASHP